MKMKSLGVFGILLASVISISACGKAESSNAHEDVAFAKTASLKEDNVWYLIAGDKTAKTPIHKDAKIDSVILTKDGQFKMFKTETGKLTLEDVSGMSSTEILDSAEKYDREKFENKLQTDTNDYESILKTAKDELDTEKNREFSDENKIEDYEKKIPLLESNMADLAKIQYESPKWKKVSYDVVTGNDNQESEIETINLSYQYLSSPIWSITNFGELINEGDKTEIIENSQKIDLISPVANTEINGKVFSGYTDKNMETILVKQVQNKEQKLVLDSK